MISLSNFLLDIISLSHPLLAKIYSQPVEDGRIAKGGNGETSRKKSAKGKRN